MMHVRVGQGFDVHRFSDDPSRPLVLGGCVFAGERGSPATATPTSIAHAVADALLGAAGLGDIGQHFPDTDPPWRGADSIALLREVAGAGSGRRGGTSANVDCAVVCEEPKLAPGARDAGAPERAAGAPGHASRAAAPRASARRAGARASPAGPWR